MMDNGQETVAWVGIARTSQNESFFFLPHGAPEGELEREKFARTVMQAIVRFSREYRREGEGREQDSVTTTSLLAELAMDYRDNGLYATREKLRARQDGKPDWARTVKSQTAFPSANGAPIYCDIVSSRHSSRATNTVARIQEQVIAEIGGAHGWWLSPYFGNREIPRLGSLAAWPRENWVRLLKLARRDIYENRAIRLVGMLVAYLEHCAESGTGEVVCGISDFSTLWEVMLRDTIPGVEHGWNRRLPRPAYFCPDGTSQKVSGMELDIVVRSGEHTIILDAKYYRASSKGFLPGVQDISKQFVYQKALEATGKVAPDKVVNAFAFPAHATGREPFNRVEFILPDAAMAPGFAPVLCQYISTADVVEAYAARRKLAEPEWLPALCA